MEGTCEFCDRTLAQQLADREMQRHECEKALAVGELLASRPCPRCGVHRHDGPRHVVRGGVLVVDRL